jgi:hypothetical protein
MTVLAGSKRGKFGIGSHFLVRICLVLPRFFLMWRLRSAIGTPTHGGFCGHITSRIGWTDTPRKYLPRTVRALLESSKASFSFRIST